MIDIRLPNITGKTDTEQLAQIKSYLYQFAGQLQWALSTVEAGGNGSNVVLQQNSAGSLTDEKTPGSLFNQLKGLIIKSADIINAYYEEFANLIVADGRFEAISQFGTFVEETRNAISVNDKKITQNIDSFQAIFDEEGHIITDLLVNGHIYYGILAYDEFSGAPIVGVEVGQTIEENGKKEFQKFARFTADRLSFYDANSIEVAYISNYQLVITNAWVKGDLELGVGSHFILDTSNGLALRPLEEV